MIDRIKTFKKFGYYPEDLSKGSHKKIVAICDHCGRERFLRLRDYCHFCKWKLKHPKQYICKEKDCNNIISLRTYFYGLGRCEKCAKQGKKHSLFGKTLYRLKNKLTKKFLVKEYINKLKSIKQISKELKCSHNTILRYLRLYKINTQRSKRLKLLLQAKKIMQYRRFDYKNVCMRSSWEIKYAKYLDSKNIVWEYESKTFNLRNMSYTPDFYLPQTNEFIEIKGWWRGNSKLRFDTFKKLYKDIKIKVLMKKDLKKLNIKL